VVHRHRDEGEDGLFDRSSRPLRCPTRTPAEVENRILALRRASHRGPVFLAGELGLVASTVGRVLRRHQPNKITPAGAKIIHSFNREFGSDLRTVGGTRSCQRLPRRTHRPKRKRGFMRRAEVIHDP